MPKYRDLELLPCKACMKKDGTTHYPEFSKSRMVDRLTCQRCRAQATYRAGSGAPSSGETWNKKYGYHTPSDPNHRMREKSGHITTHDPLVTFMYLLSRNLLTTGAIEGLIEESLSSTQPVLYTNGWLAQWAQDAVERLNKPKAEKMTPECSDDCTENCPLDEECGVCSYYRRNEWPPTKIESCLATLVPTEKSPLVEQCYECDGTGEMLLGMDDDPRCETPEKCPNCGGTGEEGEVDRLKKPKAEKMAPRQIQEKSSEDILPSGPQVGPSLHFDALKPPGVCFEDHPDRDKFIEDMNNDLIDKGSVTVTYDFMRFITGQHVWNYREESIKKLASILDVNEKRITDYPLEKCFVVNE